MRLGAAMLANGLTAEARVAVAAPLCSDPVRAVRIEAAGALGRRAARSRSRPRRGRPSRARASDYVDAQRYASRSPEAHVNLGTFFARLARFAEAQAEFASALALEPGVRPGLVNSADAYRAQGENDEALRALESAKARARTTRRSRSRWGSP